MPGVVQRQVPVGLRVLRTVEISQSQYLNVSMTLLCDAAATMQRQSQQSPGQLGDAVEAQGGGDAGSLTPRRSATLAPLLPTGMDKHSRQVTCPHHNHHHQSTNSQGWQHLCADLFFCCRLQRLCHGVRTRWRHEAAQGATAPLMGQT